MKAFDSIKKPSKPVQLVSLFPVEQVVESVGRVGKAFRAAMRLLMASKATLIALLMLAVIPLSAFEAHVVNVTATIERRPCMDFPTRNRSTWLNDFPQDWVLPQMLGNIEVNFPADAAHYLDTNAGRVDRLRAQLLALKFNIAHFGSGEAFVPGESITLNQLAAQADALLMQENPSNGDLETMKERVEDVNRARQVSTCAKCPEGNAMIVEFFHYINSSTVPVWDMWNEVDQGDHVRTEFTIAPNCEDVELSLVSYKAPGGTFDGETADEQTVYDYQTGFFSAGTHSMEIDVPSCFFQVDFVKGPIIEHLGPAGTDNFYTPQGRLLDADNGDDPGGNSCSDSLPKDEEGESFRFFSSQPLFFEEPASSTEETATTTDETATSPEEFGEVLGENASSTEPAENTTSTDPAGSPQTEETPAPEPAEPETVPEEPVAPTSTEPISEPPVEEVPEETPPQEVPPQEEETPPPAPEELLPPEAEGGGA